MATLLEFKAGQVDFNNDTGDAVPLAGQGRVVLKHSSEDPSFLGLQWFPRAKNRSASGEELLLLPGDVEFSHSHECSTGRVVQMRFQSSGERHFFWLQDAPQGDLHELSAEDTAVIAKLNELVNEYDPGDDAADDSMQVDESTPLTEEQSSGPSTSGASARSEQVSQLNAALRSALAQKLGQAQPQAGPSAPRAPHVPQAPLSKQLDAASRAAHVASASDEQLARMLEQVPGLAATRAELEDVVRSPYFATALDTFGQAVLQSPALAKELGMPRPPTSIADFVQLLQQMARASEHSEAGDNHSE